MVVNDNSHRTAITRNKPSAPITKLLELGLIQGDVLDFGCGRGFDADHFGFDKYDPYYFPETPNCFDKNYDTIVCIYVLNVLPEENQAAVIQNVRGLLKPGGFGYLAVRRDIKEEGPTSRGTYQCNVVLDCESVAKTSGFEIYKVTK